MFQIVFKIHLKKGVKKYFEDNNIDREVYRKFYHFTPTNIETGVSNKMWEF